MATFNKYRCGEAIEGVSERAWTAVFVLLAHQQLTSVAPVVGIPHIPSAPDRDESSFQAENEELKNEIKALRSKQHAAEVRKLHRKLDEKSERHAADLRSTANQSFDTIGQVASHFGAIGQAVNHFGVANASMGSSMGTALTKSLDI